jgi:hypothetical protein
MRSRPSWFGLWVLAVVLGGGALANAQSQPPSLRITVNSAADAPPQPDAALTLREAIALANGTLTLAELSPPEQAQVQPLAAGETTWIGFNLPSDETTLYLTDVLPPLTVPVTLDGTSQPGYGATQSELPNIPIPVVSLTPAPGTEVLRGLTVAGSGVTIQGLSIYGFWSSARATLTTPPADIFIASAPPPADASPDTPLGGSVQPRGSNPGYCGSSPAPQLARGTAFWGGARSPVCLWGLCVQRSQRHR